jgi:membrane fusion protein, adhesin transport system
MYLTTKEARSSERDVLRDQIGQKTKTIERLTQALSTAKENLSVVSESRNIYAKLAGEGLASRTVYLKRQEEYNTRSGEVTSFIRQIEEAQKELTEYRRRFQALAAQQRDAAYNDLHRVESDLAQARETLKKRESRVARLEVRSPVMGYVKGLKLNTIGSVIPAGQTLMEIVPVEEQLVVEVRIPPQQIGRIEAGQQVQVKFDSYDYVRYGTIDGKLESISAMTFTDEARREDYYKGRVRLMRNYAGTTPGVNPVIPGMTVDADIVTGEKSVLGYLLKPIRTALNNAMTEQ